MAGLLDFLQTPAGMGLLSGVASYAANARRGAPVNSIGRGLAGGITGYAQANDQIRQDKEKQLADQYRQMQMDEMRQKIESQKAIREASTAAYKGAYKPPVAAMPPSTTFAPSLGGDSPLIGGLNAAMGGDFSNAPLMSEQQAVNLPEREAQPGGFDPEAYRQQMFGKLAESGYVDEAMKFAPKERAPIKAGEGDVLIDPVTLKPVYSVPKTQSLPGAVQEYQFARSQGYKGTFDQWKKSNARAGASNITQSNFGEPKPFWNQKTGRYEFYQFDKTGNPRVAPLPEGASPVDEGKLPEGQAKQVVGVTNLQGAIGEYVNQLKSWNKVDALRPDARAAMGVKYNNMMLQAKEAYNLGVLNGPDFEILTSVVTDPRSFTGAITSTKALEKQAQELSRIMNGIKQSAATKSRPMNGREQEPAMSLDDYLKSQGH